MSDLSIQPSHVYLQEDALELWHGLLKRSSTLTPELLALLPSLVALLEQGTDILPKCLAIFESYLLLDAPRVMEVSLPEPRLRCLSSFARWRNDSRILYALSCTALQHVLLRSDFESARRAPIRSSQSRVALDEHDLQDLPIFALGRCSGRLSLFPKNARGGVAASASCHALRTMQALNSLMIRDLQDTSALISTKCEFCAKCER